MRRRAPTREEWGALVDELICEHCGARPRRNGRAPLLFHHRDPDSKTSDVAKIAYRLSWTTTLAEIAKCDVVCRRCHHAAHPDRIVPRGTIDLPAGAMTRKPNPLASPEGFTEEPLSDQPCSSPDENPNRNSKASPEGCSGRRAVG